MIVDQVADRPSAIDSSTTDISRDVAASVWLSVSDDLLWGFNHELSNRLAAITSIAKILEHSDTGLDPLLSVLTGEIQTLENTLDLLRLIPRNPDGVPEPLLLEDIIPEAVRLSEMRGDFRDFGYETAFEGDAQPVWMEYASLVHALLISLGTVSRATREAGGGRVVIRVDSAPERVIVRVRPAGVAGESSTPGEHVATREVELGRSLVVPYGGCFDVEEKGEGVRLELPTLLAVREARERSGGR